MAIRPKRPTLPSRPMRSMAWFWLVVIPSAVSPVSGSGSVPFATYPLPSETSSSGTVTAWLPRLVVLVRTTTKTKMRPKKSILLWILPPRERRRVTTRTPTPRTIPSSSRNQRMALPVPQLLRPEDQPSPDRSTRDLVRREVLLLAILTWTGTVMARAAVTLPSTADRPSIKRCLGLLMPKGIRPTTPASIPTVVTPPVGLA
mmetsp:Transcript_25055/g.54257  ORF Transcript_25055/g.54257 Transcript_25055/m.54257 type:complete len:202 (-) Transcript_25055:506-1111(-)